MRRFSVVPLCFFLLPSLTFGQAAGDSSFVSSLPLVRVMVDDDFSPLSRWDERSGTYEGIGVDLFRQAAAKLGLKYELVHEDKPWAQKVELFNSGGIDALLPVSVTADRAARGIFTSSYYETFYAVIALKTDSRKLNQTQQLAAWHVGAVSETAIVPYLQNFVPADHLELFATTKALYQALRDGKIEFGLQNLVVFDQERYDQELFDLEVVHSVSEWPRRYAFYFADTPAFARLVPLLNKAMTGIDVAPLMARYGRGAEDLILRYTEQKHWQDLLLVVLTGSVGVLLLLGVLLWNQRRLKESEARFRALSEASYGGIAIHENLVILECNQGLVDMTGYSREELIGMNGLNLLSSESGAVVVDNIRAGVTTSYEVEGRRKDQSSFPLGVRGKSIPYKGRTVRVTEFTDLSGPKSAEAAIRKAKQLYDDLVAKIPMGIYFLRSHPDGSSKFEFVSPRMAEILGYGVEEILADGSKASEIFAPEEREWFEELNRRSLATGKPFDWTGRVLRGGEERWLHISSTSEPQNGDFVWHGTVVDITEQKLAEDRIAALLEEKELVLKEVHHRIKNNMSTVSGLLTLQAATLSDSAAVEALENAKGRVLSMMVLYDKLYVSTDSQAVSLQVFLPSLVDEVLANFPNVGMVTYETKAEDIVLDARTLSSLGIIVNELLTNVMKYAFLGRQSGAVTVTATRAAGSIQVSVRDDGRGLPEGFDLSQSAGFGLSLVDMLLRHLKGRLTVVRGGGTIVVLEFPG